MENQHRKIAGYRELSQEEIDAMNRVKTMAGGIAQLCIDLREKVHAMPIGTVEQRAELTEALRWLDAGEMQLQQGFMAITRSIARPTTF